MELHAQVVLTPTEAKRLLSAAVLALDEVKRALDKGIVIVHPSSTTIFMLEELGYEMHPQGLWVCGHISPIGLCIARPMIEAVLETPEYGAEKYPFDYVLKNGELLSFEHGTLGPTLEEMGSKDIYVKSVNAIDPENKLGVLLAARSSGGSIGLVLKKQKEKKFKLLLPVGVEKRIQVPLSKATKAALKTTKAMGIPCSLWRLRGKLITEIEAFKVLFDVEAVPISAGGVSGAEGAVLWVISGEEKKVTEAFDWCEAHRGHEFPYELDVFACGECPNTLCQYAGGTDKEMQV